MITTAAFARLAWRASQAAVGVVGSNLIPPLDDRLHPVARFGRTMQGVERVLWRDDRLAGVAYALIGVGVGAAAGAATTVASAVSVTVAGRQLRDEARDVEALLRRGDLTAARVRVRSLVGRDTSTLDESDVAAAVIESVAENMVDAVYAPVLWTLIGGRRGAGAYRAVNTMDAMVGRRNARYERFGWAAARLDDLLNLAPARLFATAVATVRPDRIGPITTAVRDDAPAHPSPNAGVAEAAMAGALGVQLGGPLRYGDDEEDRPTLGSGPRPGTDDINRAIAVARQTEALLVAWLLGLTATTGIAAVATTPAP